MALQGKRMLSALSTGGGEHTYQRDGYQRYTMREFLIPIEQTAVLCRMEYLSPFVVFGSFLLEHADIQAAAVAYQRLVIGLRDEQIDFAHLTQYPIITPPLVDRVVTKELAP